MMLLWCQLNSSYPISGTKPERWILVSDEEERIANNPVLPTDNTLDEVKEWLGVAACEEDCEPSDDNRYEGSYPQNYQHHVVRNGQEPLDER